MSAEKLDPRLKALIDKVTAKRARVVLDHILQHGFITTEDLAKYGYNHPPRAARDVRELGIPLETYRVLGNDGRKIAAYRLGDPAKVQKHKLGGRQTLSKELHDLLYQQSNGRCFTCGHAYEARYLQVDHRVPYEIAGEAAPQNHTEAFMLLCGSCQRKKSWSCEHCPNWENLEAQFCLGCYWVDPENHRHVAGEDVRRIDLTFAGDDANAYDRASDRVKREGGDVRDTMRQAFLDILGP